MGRGDLGTMRGGCSGRCAGEPSLCIHLPSAGRRRRCESRQCLQCQRGLPHRGGTLTMGLCQKRPPQPASSPRHPSAGIWWLCHPGEGGQLRQRSGGMPLWGEGGNFPPGSGVGYRGHGGGQRGWGGVLGPAAARGWGELPCRWPGPGCCAKAGAWARGGQRAFARGCGSVLPTRHRGVFPLGRRCFQGRRPWGGLLPSPSGCSRNVPQFPLLWSRLAPPLPAPTWLPGGCYGLCRVLRRGHGGKPGRWAGSWGRLALCESPQHTPGGAAAAIGVCHAAFAVPEGFATARGISQGVVSARKPERKGRTGGLCPRPAAAAQGQERTLSPQPRRRSPSVPSAGSFSPADGLRVGKG